MTGQNTHDTLVSIILPTRNEELWIAKTLDCLLEEIEGRDDAEILCVDGMSEDATRKIIADYSKDDPRIRMIDNPGITLPKALNVGIRNARGEIILRMDSHATCTKGYVEKNVELLQRTKAECVGGYLSTEPDSDSPTGWSIAAALSSKFGVGGCKSRTSGDEEVESDEATFGCFPKSLFEKIGYFDERLTRNQDMEYFCRIRDNGGRIIISPEIRVTYFCRSNYSRMAQQAFKNGVWGAYTLWLIKGGLCLRHLIPLFFVLSLAALTVGGIIWTPIFLLLGLELLTYFSAGAVYAFKAAKNSKAKPLLVFLAFVRLHVSYGLGTLYGLLTGPFKFGKKKATAS